MRSPRRSKSVVGYRFHPTDEELVAHFLKRKLLGSYDQNLSILEIKVCDYEPWQLHDMFRTESSDQAWYFFSPRDYKYSGSTRINRKTKFGYWKPTGKPRKVTEKGTKKVIGTKRSLVFYKTEDPKPLRTTFIMHEYDLINNSKGRFLLYKLKVKLDENINHMASSPSDFESQVLGGVRVDMACNSDFGNQSYETEEITDAGCSESETDYYLVSDIENEAALENVEDQNQNYMNVPQAATLISGSQNIEVNESEGSKTFFDELKALFELEDVNTPLSSHLTIEECLSCYGTNFPTFEQTP